MKALFLDLGLFLFSIITFFFSSGVLHIVWFFISVLFYTLCVACVVIIYYQEQAKNLLNRAGRRGLK